MSITPKQWSEKDDKGTLPDASLRLETYFNTADGYLYRVIDFLKVQEPGTEHQVYPEGRKGEAMPSYTELRPGDERWYIVLEKNDDLGPRRAFRYDDFRDDLNNGFHRVKNDKPKSQTRGIELERDVEAEGQRAARPRHRTDNPDYVAPRGAERFDHTGDRAAQDAELAARRARVNEGIEEAQQKSQPSIQYPRDAIDAG